MKLPIRDLPQYSLDLPVSGITVKYRPHTVKEEQIHNMATMSDNDQDKLEAVFQICENCVDYNIYNIFPAEVEYLFMKIKACSDTPKIQVAYEIQPEIDPESGENIHKNCGEEIITTFDINTDVEIMYDLDKMQEYATRNEDGSWVIDLKNDIKIQIRVRPLTEITDSSMYDLIESIIDEKEDTVMYREIDFNRDELTSWIENLPSTSFENFNNFMGMTPSCVAHLDFKCRCGKVHKEDEYGVLRFLV